MDILKARRIIYLTAGFIKDELNFGEQQELAAWKNESHENRFLFDELVNDENRTAAVAKMQQFGTEESLYRMKQQMAVLTQKQKKRISLLWYAAAILVVGIGAAFLLTRPSGVPSELLTVNAPYGKLLHITLPDGSKVWLDAGTTLQYSPHFTGKTRTIRLKDGEAFFDVVHDPGKPFVVEANSAQVVVIGTSFDIKAFANENETKVTVSSGKVGVLPAGPQKSAALLLPNEQAIIVRQTKRLTIHKINAADMSTWRDNKLVFEKEDFQNVMNALERKYNVRINVLNKDLLHQKITLRLDNQPITDVLSVMGFSNNFTYTIQSRQLIVVK